MKLRNLLFATMFACTFASCSNEDDPISTDPVVGEGPATLSVQVQGAASTKGAVTGEAASQRISFLTVIVFKNEVIETVATAANTKVVSTEAGKLTEGNKEVLVLANVPEAVLANIQIGKSKADVLALTVDYNTISSAKASSADNENEGYLSMNSKIYSVTLVSGKNVLGREAKVGEKLVDAAPVKLYRNVAIINLKSVKTAEFSALAPSVIKFTDPTLTVTNLYINNARNTSMLVGANATEWGTTMSETSDLLTGYLKKDKGVAPSYVISSYMSGVITSDAATTDKIVDINKGFYAYENTSETYTQLIIQGDFTYTDAATQKPVTLKDRFYTVNVGVGVDYGSNNWWNSLRGTETLGTGLYRNLQYNIALIVTGSGSAEPGVDDKTGLEVTVEVVAFGEVSQDVEQ